MTNQKNIDAPSIGGQFGWERIGTDTDFAIPVIVRGSGVRFSPVRIVEQELIKRYEMLPQSVFQCITLKSFYLTSCETKLLNDINFNHCNSRYGDALFSTRDVIISAPDVKELSRYLNISHEIFSKGLTPQVNATVGLIKLVTEPGQTGLIYVPYILKRYQDRQVRFVPSKIIEPFVTKSPHSVRGAANDWDVMYLKMLCTYCENNLQVHITRDIILLDGLLYSKSNTPLVFEDY